MQSETDVRTWREAWQWASFSEQGFYLRDIGVPARNFRTSAHVGGPFVTAMSDWVRAIDRRLGQPAQFDIVDVGAGDGELLGALATELAATEPDLLSRSRMVACDVRPRPVHLDYSRIEWVQGFAPGCLPDSIVGVVIATEFLDDVPLDVAQRGPGQPWHYQLVDENGTQSPGPLVEGLDLDWINRWVSAATNRIEIGAPRDVVALELVARIAAGSALFVDYCVSDGNASHGQTLQAFSRGHQRKLAPRSDVNVTAAVFEPSLVAATRSLGEVTVESQRNVLRGCGDDLMANRMTAGTAMARLQWRSQYAELTEAGGLGDQLWITIDRTP